MVMGNNNPDPNELERIIDYARQMGVNIGDAVFTYGQLRHLNRRRAYERTIDYIFLQKENMLEIRK